MVEFSQEELRRFIDSDKCRCQSIYKGTGFQVYIKTKIDAELVNIFAFDNVPQGIKIITEDIRRENLKFAVEKSSEKNRFIDFNEYVISLPSSKENPDQVDFSAAHLYRKRGAIVGKVSSQVSNLGEVHCNRLVVIDHKLLIVCNYYATKVLCVIEDELRLIPLNIAEQLLRTLSLNWKTLENLDASYPLEDWTFQNGLLINEHTMSVPSTLQFYFYKSRRRGKQVDAIKANLDFTKLIKILTRDEKGEAQISYIDSKHI